MGQLGCKSSFRFAVNHDLCMGRAQALNFLPFELTPDSHDRSGEHDCRWPRRRFTVDKRRSNHRQYPTPAPTRVRVPHPLPIHTPPERARACQVRHLRLLTDEARMSSWSG